MLESSLSEGLVPHNFWFAVPHAQGAASGVSAVVSPSPHWFWIAPPDWTQLQEGRLTTLADDVSLSLPCGVSWDPWSQPTPLARTEARVGGMRELGSFQSRSAFWPTMELIAFTESTKDFTLQKPGLGSLGQWYALALHL